MTPATQEQIEEACMTRSADETRFYLASIGYYAKVVQCREAIVRLTLSGVREPLKSGAVDTEIKAIDAITGCERMLRRHLTTGKHWISDPAKMHDALRLAGMVS